MLRWGLFCLFWLVLVPPVAATMTVSQQEWMQQLVDALGWGYGLPDDPLPEDYLKLLSGERSLRVEAEEGFRKTDLVTIKRLANFGEFSGSGWLSGRRETSQVHFDLLVPHPGAYTLQVASLQSGVVIQLADRKFIVDAGDKLTTQVVGEVELVAGEAEVKVTLPPNTGIDYLQLTAPSLPAVAPLSGWNLDAELALDDLAMTVLQALKLLPIIPEKENTLLFEAENAAPQDGVDMTTERHLGAVSGGRWVRAGHQQVAWDFSAGVNESGCYQVDLSGVGAEPVELQSVIIPNQQVFWGEAIRKESLGRICMTAGQLKMRLTLPARAGVDFLELRRLDTSSEMLSILLGLQPGATLDEPLVNELLKLLSHLKH